MRIVLILVLATQSLFAFAEQATDSTGDYAMDLGQVYSAIRAVKFMKEICEEAFPEYIQPNEVAYQKWRVRFKPFLQEVEKHWSTSMWREAKGDPQQHMAVLRKMDDTFMQYREGLRKQLMSDGQDMFRGPHAKS